MDEITVHEAAALLGGVSRTFLDNAVARGRLAWVSDASPRRLSRAAVEELSRKMAAALEWRNERARLKAKRRRIAYQLREVDRAIREHNTRRPARYLGGRHSKRRSKP